MGSGNKRVIWHTRERAVSTDNNRAESMVVTDAHEAVRARNNQDTLGSFNENPGLVQPYTALPGAPDVLIPHDCLSGLLVRPDNAGFLLIDPGEAGFFVPAFSGATADDSKYILIASAGVSDTGLLTFTANAGPGIRWDIVECQPTEALLESSSRDIYDANTGIFTPALVEKVRGGVLTFRIRQGTQGAGIPDIDPAWMPLAAVHVRTDSTGFTNCDVYDVRPLVAERCPFSMRHPLSPPSSDRQYRAKLYEASLAIGTDPGVNGWTSRGFFRGHFGGYYSGGKLQKNVPATNLADFGATGVTGGSFTQFNWEDVKNQVSGGLTASDHVIVLGAFFPKGYPRWVRYSQAALSPNTTNRLRITGRVPQGPRGILVVTNGGDLQNGIISPQNLPAAVGEPTAAWGHVVAYGLFDTSEGAVYPPIGTAADGHYQWTGALLTAGFSAWPFAAAALTDDVSTPTIWTVQGQIAPGFGFAPAAARGVCAYLRFAFAHPTTGGHITFSSPMGQLTFGTTSTPLGTLYPGQAGFNRRDVPIGLNSTIAEFINWIPLNLHEDWDGVSAGSNLTAVALAGSDSIGLTSITATMTILGYVF